MERCGSCGATALESVLWLGYSPPACSMRRVGERLGEEAQYPLELLRCGTCSLVQLSCAVDPGVVFHREYPYSSGNTKALLANFAELAGEVREAVDLGPRDLVVDVGANDGSLLANFHPGVRVLAIDPTDQVQTAAQAGMATMQHFFSLRVAEEARAEHGPAKVVTITNALAHVDDVHDVLAGIKHLLAEDGVLVTENHHLDSVTGGQWDTVYHEHRYFYSPESLTGLLVGHGLYPWRCDPIATHGGSFRMFASKIEQPYTPPESVPLTGLAGRVARSRVEIKQAVASARLEGRRVWGIGAAARATTVINCCGLDHTDVECVCEVPGSDKLGHYMPGTRIPVVDEAALFTEQPELALLFSWHVADFLIPKLRERGYQGTFIVPLPKVRYE